MVLDSVGARNSLARDSLARRRLADELHCGRGAAGQGWAALEGVDTVEKDVLTPAYQCCRARRYAAGGDDEVGDLEAVAARSSDQCICCRGRSG